MDDRSLPLTTDFNRLFDRLVMDQAEDQPLRGFVAYVFYKIAKREWVREQCDKLGGPPSPEAVRGYIASWTDSRIDGLKLEAETSLVEFASSIIDGERPKIEAAALKEKSFWRDVGVGIVAAFIWTLLLIVFAIILKWWTHIDVISIFTKAVK